MPDWDMNGDTTRAGYEAQIAYRNAELEKLRAERDAARDKALEEAASLVEDELWRGAGCARHIRALREKP